MNIIKLKDILMPDKYNMSEMYNMHLKGKYAYWIQMRYIVPFEFMGHEGYVACEEDITKLLMKADGTYPKPYGCPYIDMYDEDKCIMRYIDLEATDIANNISKYRTANDQTTDFDITISELKLFRKKLATMILDYNNIYINDSGSLIDSIEESVLKYYMNDMYDEAVKSLLMFGNQQVTLSTVDTTCGCCSSTTLASLNNSSLNICDPLSIYRKSIYNKMVTMFSDVEFWKRWPNELLVVMKKYIDNILKVGLNVNNNTVDPSIYRDCTCSNSNTNTNQNILEKLSKSLDYMIEGQEKSHYNYIKYSLYNWASLLYEYMQW